MKTKEDYCDAFRNIIMTATEAGYLLRTARETLFAAADDMRKATGGDYVAASDAYSSAQTAYETALEAYLSATEAYYEEVSKYDRDVVLCARCDQPATIVVWPEADLDSACLCDECYDISGE